MKRVTTLAVALVVVVCLITCSAQTCIKDLATYLGTCGAILGYKIRAGQILAACPDYWRAKNCIFYYLMPCNSTVQATWNASYAPITTLFERRCQFYKIPTSGLPTQSPLCNLTEIYIESTACIGTLEADAQKLKYAWDLPPFCKKYKTAWACAMSWIRPCSYAKSFFNKTMDGIKNKLDPYCGNPDGAAALSGTVLVMLSAFAFSRLLLPR